MTIPNSSNLEPRVWTDADLASTFQHGYKAGRNDGAFGMIKEIEAEMGPVGRFIDRLQERWEFLR
jgi:hypothetical protein